MTRSCSDIDECALPTASNGCPNGGTCLNTVGSFSCRCSQGFFGPRCQEEGIDYTLLCRRDYTHVTVWLHARGFVTVPYSRVLALPPQSTMTPEEQGGGSDGDGDGGLSGALVFAIAAGVLLVLTSAMAYVAMKRRSERRKRRQAEQLARIQSSMLSVSSSMGSIASFY